MTIMKTLLALFATSLLITGCSTPAPVAEAPARAPSIAVQVKQAGAKVTLYDSAGQIITEHTTDGGTTTFDTSKLEGYVTLEVSAPDYVTERRIYRIDAAIPARFDLSQDWAAINERNKTVQRKELAAFLQDAAVPYATRKAVSKHKPLVGMRVAEARLAFGELQFVARSEGVGGTVESWCGADSSYRYSLYFVDGQLDRWTTTSLY